MWRPMGDGLQNLPVYAPDTQRTRADSEGKARPGQGRTGTAFGCRRVAHRPRAGPCWQGARCLERCSPRELGWCGMRLLSDRGAGLRTTPRHVFA